MVIKSIQESQNPNNTSINGIPNSDAGTVDRVLHSTSTILANLELLGNDLNSSGWKKLSKSNSIVQLRTPIDRRLAEMWVLGDFLCFFKNMIDLISINVLNLKSTDLSKLPLPCIASIRICTVLGSITNFIWGSILVQRSLKGLRENWNKNWNLFLFSLHELVRGIGYVVFGAANFTNQILATFFHSVVFVQILGAVAGFVMYGALLIRGLYALYCSITFRNKFKEFDKKETTHEQKTIEKLTFLKENSKVLGQRCGGPFAKLLETVDLEKLIETLNNPNDHDHNECLEIADKILDEALLGNKRQIFVEVWRSVLGLIGLAANIAASCFAGPLGTAAVNLGLTLLTTYGAPVLCALLWSFLDSTRLQKAFLDVYFEKHNFEPIIQWMTQKMNAEKDKIIKSFKEIPTTELFKHQVFTKKSVDDIPSKYNQIQEKVKKISSLVENQLMNEVSPKKWNVLIKIREDMEYLQKDINSILSKYNQIFDYTDYNKEYSEYLSNRREAVGDDL